MKKFLTIFLLLTYGICSGQTNLVPNPSFENYTMCPPIISKLYLAPPWFQPHTWHGNVTNSCSSDLFNSCSSTSSSGVPYNTHGFQYPRTGNGYAGGIPYTDTFNYREYIEVGLLDTLITNHSYCVEFYVSLANNYGVALSSLGAYFSNDSLLDNSYQAHTINYVTPQVENPIGNMLTDTLNWMLVSGSFVATGGEKFMTIGNFYVPSNTNSLVVDSAAYFGAYYYFDDVSVVDCASVGVDELGMRYKELEIAPNPFTSSTTITFSNEQKNATIKITDILGEEIMNYELGIRNGKSVILDLSGYTKGIYFVQIRDEKKNIYNKKIILSN